MHVIQEAWFNTTLKQGLKKEIKFHFKKAYNGLPILSPISLFKWLCADVYAAMFSIAKI